MSAMTPPLMTVAEFMARPQPLDGSKEELVRGRIVKMPPTQGRHGIIQWRIARLVGGFIDDHKLGWPVTESGTILEQDPATVRGPDFSYYSYERQPSVPEGYFEQAPDFAVEILSPSDRPSRVMRKVDEYLEAGVRMVWVVDPEDRTVLVYRPNQRGQEFSAGQTLDGADVLPGLTIPVDELFR